MKTLTLIMVVLAGWSAQAKISDFNAIIVENINSQKELHFSLRHNLSDTQVAVEKEELKSTEPKYIVDNASSINVPASDKNFLRFKKELKYNRASQEAANKRLAAELDGAE